jgi:putative CocE/NonD family hydrolase
MVLTRTPYGLGHDADGFSPAMTTQYKELAEDGYIFVFQDIRGRFQSEGQFVMMRNPRDPKDAKAIDEGTDTYDTIDWMLKNVPGNNGRVGMLGISYGGWLTAMAILEPHPGAQGRVTQASPIDMWMGRRLPPQRRVPPGLRVRIRRHDGSRQGDQAIRFR